MRELKRITRPSGHIFVTTPNNHALSSKLTFLMRGQHRQFQAPFYPAHVSPLLKCDLERMATDLNLSIVNWLYSNNDVIPALGIPIHLPGPRLLHEFRRAAAEVLTARGYPLPGVASANLAPRPEVAGYRTIRLPIACRGKQAHLEGMARAVLSIVGIVATIAVLIWCFGITMPQVTTNLPALNRSVMRTVGLMSGGASENGRGPAENNAGSSPAPAQSGPAPGNSSSPPANSTASSPPGSPHTPSAAPTHSDEAEIISPDSTAYLNSAHIHGIDQPRPPGFRPPATVRPSIPTRRPSPRPIPCPRIRIGPGTWATASSPTSSSCATTRTW